MAGDVQIHYLDDDGLIPNNSERPLIVYPGAMTGLEAADDPAALFEHRFVAHGWTGSWRNGIFPYHHYHSTAHEVLGCYAGSAIVQLGGESGVSVEMRPGDVVVIPAGVGHKRLSSGRVGIVGAYPDGRSPDMNYGRREERERAIAAIRGVPVPQQDPVRGADGPLPRLYRGD
ncbi:MAG: cupin domain-containing protein [Spirochaetota bacterium]